MRYRNLSTGRIVNVAAGQVDEFDQSPRWAADGAAPQPASEPDLDIDPARPAVADPKDVWIGYAESLRVDTTGMTKQQLIDAVGDG